MRYLITLPLVLLFASPIFAQVLNVGQCGLFTLGMTVEEAKSNIRSEKCESFMPIIDGTGFLMLRERSSQKAAGAISFLAGRLNRITNSHMYGTDTKATNALDFLFRILASRNCTDSQHKVEALGMTKILRFRCSQSQSIAVSIRMVTNVDQDMAESFRIDEEIEIP
jgi:hypothetical protein